MRDLARLPPSMSDTRTMVPAGYSVKGLCICSSLKIVVEVENKYQPRSCQWGTRIARGFIIATGWSETVFSRVGKGGRAAPAQIKPLPFKGQGCK
jgi:hypothetical protein